MMVSDEEKRWLVVGIAMNKVAAPVLRDFIKQGMASHYANNTYCHGLTTPCTLKTLTYHQVTADPYLQHLKFQNINNNLQLYGLKKKDLHKYNYNINSSVDLAKLFLPDYLATFSGFDDSLDMSAILRLLGFNNPAPIFYSPMPSISIQLSADDVRENVRNTWGHCNVTDWTEVFFNDCFSKLKTLVKSLGLTLGMEKMALDQLSDWETKGCQLCMGHAVDHNLLSLVQQDVKKLIMDFRTTEESLAQQRVDLTATQNTVTSIQDQQSATRVQLEEHGEQLVAVLEWKEQQMKENEEILAKLVSVKKMMSEELLMRVERVEKGHAETDDKVKQLEQGFVRIEKDASETGDKVKQLEEEVRSQRMKENKSGSSVQGRPPLSMEHNQLPFPACSQTSVKTSQTQSHPYEASIVNTFDVKTCQRKLAEYYQKTAKVPTTAWSLVLQVDLEQTYTRLSWVKREQTTAGLSEEELNHYTDIFTEKTKSGVAKRILVQGETGIGKTTFVKKLLMDWSNLEEAKMNEKQKDALRKFNLVVSINLKEVSKCRTFKEVLSQSRVFPDDETPSIDDLLSYVGETQDKVLLVFDGYDEYRTGSEAEKCGSRSKSPIFEIFHGNVLRDCTVLVTTRSSLSDELQECADIHAEITGFNSHDREAFMLKFLEGSQTEVDGLLKLLQKSKLNDLARVPLLNLFFCLLWKEEKEKLKEGFKSKTELFQAIMKHILQHSHKRHSASNASQVKEADYNEILTAIGKVALEGLLRGDLLFKFGQLSEKVRGEESIIVGLLQVSEYGPSVEPKEMVSFIHKSIQEYLAALFVTNRCVPEGNLGGIEQHACTVEDCTALENVFKFVSGLSNQGAEKVFEHFSSVRTRDLAMTIADADSQTDLPLYDLTERHWRFSDLAFSCFREVKTRTKPLRRFLDCFGEIVPVPNHVLRSPFTPNIQDVSTLSHSRTFAFRFHLRDSIPHKSLEQFIKCFHIPRTTQSAEVQRVGDFLDKLLIIREHEAIWGCSLHFILRFSIDQFQFYITDLSLCCDDHARLFTETTEMVVPSVAANLCSEAESCLKFVRSLRCSSDLSDEAMKCLGGAIRDCKQLRFIEITMVKDSVCKFLKQVPNPSKCSLKLGTVGVHGRIERGSLDVCLTPAGAVKLSNLLPRFNNISHLCLNFTGDEVELPITSITHSSLKRLRLSGMILTPAAVAALGRSLPEMSSLEIFDLSVAWNQGSWHAVDMEALFGRFNTTLPLWQLALSGVSDCLAPLTKSFRFFPNLQKLHFEKLNMNEQNVCDLLEGLRFIPNVRLVSVQGKNEGRAHLSTANVNSVTSFTLENLEKLILNGISLNPAAAGALGRSLPEMSSLERLELTGIDANILEAEVMELLFGGFTKPVPLQEFSFGGFSVKGCLTPLTNSLHFFSKLSVLRLLEVIIDDQDLSGLLESLRFLPNLETLCVENKRLAPADSSVVEVNTVHSVSHRNCRELTLKGISLTPTIAAILGQSLPKMSSLTELKLTGLDGSVVPAEQMERLFDGFTEKLPVETLHFSGFNVRGCLAPLTRSFSSFPNLMHLSLENLNMDEHDLRGLLESFRFIPNLEELDLSGNPLGHAVTSIVPHVINLPELYSLNLCRTGSEADLSSVTQELCDCRVEVYTTFSSSFP